MNRPVANNQALIPRHPSRYKDSYKTNPDDNEIIGKAVTYAPPGASFRARVKYLNDEDRIESVIPIDDNRLREFNLENYGSGPEDNNEMKIKIESEVQIKGQIPENGFIIEQKTHIIPAVKNGRL